MTPEEELELEVQRYLARDFAHKCSEQYKELLKEIEDEQNDGRTVREVGETESGREDVE